MHYKSRRLESRRRSMEQELLHNGWVGLETPYPPNGKVELYAKYQSPRIIEIGVSDIEQCLKKINRDGESYYALETWSWELTYLSWQTDRENPRNHNYIPVWQAFDCLHDCLLEGIDWKYEDGRSGNIKVIDWEHPEMNTFSYVRGWRGAMNDGFGWDFVLFVNAIPLAGIVLEPDEKGGRPCAAALSLAQDQMNSDSTFSVYAHYIIAGNGKELRMGVPYEELDEFMDTPDTIQAIKPENFLKKIKDYV